MITFDNVSKRFARSAEALNHVSFHVDKGEMAFLTGHSGAGKTTLLKLLALIDQASAGEIYFDGHALSQVTTSQMYRLRRSMGLIFQRPMLLNDRNVFHNVALPLQILSHDHHDILKRTRAALDMVGLLAMEKQLPGVLSAGEQQRVGIARAIVHRPLLILADEPTGNLDPELSKEIIELFVRLNEFGVTVFIATHDLSLIATMRHPIFVLRQGRMVC